MNGVYSDLNSNLQPIPFGKDKFQPDNREVFCIVVLLDTQDLVHHCTPLVVLWQGHNLEVEDLELDIKD